MTLLPLDCMIKTPEPRDTKLLAESETKVQKSHATGSSSSIYKCNAHLISLTLSFLDINEMIKIETVDKLFRQAIPFAMNLLLSSQIKPKQQNILFKMISQKESLKQVMQKNKQFQEIDFTLSIRFQALAAQRGIDCSTDTFNSMLLQNADGPIDLSPSDSIIESNKGHLSKIRSLKANGGDFTDKSLSALYESEGCLNIKEINFSYIKVSTGSLITFAKRCQALTTLNLNGLEFADTHLDAFVKSSKLVSLTLNMTLLTPSALQNAASHLAQLEKFVFTPILSANYFPALLEIFQKCNLLREFSIKDVSLPSEDVCALISLRNGTLEVITLERIQLGRNEVLNTIAEKCTVLKQITFRGCRNYTDQDMKEFMASRPTVAVKTESW